MREKMKMLLGSDNLEIGSLLSNDGASAVDNNKDHDTEESEIDTDFKLEPLPRAADIIAELPDYPDSEEEMPKNEKKVASAVSQDIEININANEEKLIFESDDKEIDEVSEISLTRQSKRQRIEAPKSNFEPKKYLNREGEFVTGFDPMTAEAKYRRQLRMKRFGKHEVIENSKFDDKLTSVSDDEAALKDVMFDRRPEAVHLFGTDDMSTDDILGYFKEFCPHHIEWLDDSHCNVVWTDINTAKRALTSMSKKYTAEELEEVKQELRRREKEEDDFYLLPGTLNRPPNDEYKTTWRLASKSNKKAPLLFMRFANTGDVKKMGSYKTSRYYSLYGNPNAPFLKTNNYKRNLLSQKQATDDTKKTNSEIKKDDKNKKPDLRRHLNKGKIDVEQIKEEYKIGKPLIETLTIEVDRNEDDSDIEVKKDSVSHSDISEAEEPERKRRKALPSDASKLKRTAKKRPVKEISSSTSSTSESSSDDTSDISSSSSSSSDSSSSDSSDSSSDSSSGRMVVMRQKPVKKSTKSKNQMKHLYSVKNGKRKRPSSVERYEYNERRRKRKSMSSSKGKPSSDLRRKLQKRK